MLCGKPRIQQQQQAGRLLDCAMTAVCADGELEMPVRSGPRRRMWRGNDDQWFAGVAQARVLWHEALSVISRETLLVRKCKHIISKDRVVLLRLNVSRSVPQVCSALHLRIVRDEVARNERVHSFQILLISAAVAVLLVNAGTDSHTYGRASLEPGRHAGICSASLGG